MLQKIKNYSLFILFPLILGFLVIISHFLIPTYKYKISVVMPVYNTEKYLHQNIESVLNQTLKDFEFIIVNDASTDSSLNIIKKYAAEDSRIKIIDLPQNLGAGNARNEGIKHITGKYTIFIDSDDWLENKMLEEMYTHAEKHNLDMVISDAKIFDETNQEYLNNDEYSFLLSEYLNEHNIKIFSYKNLKSKFFQITPKYLWNKLIRSQLIKRHNLQFMNIEKHNDSYFATMALVLSKRISYISDALYVYRINRSGNISSTKQENAKIIYEIFVYIKQSLQEHKIYQDVKTSFNSWIFGWLTADYPLTEETKEYLEKLIELTY